MPDANMPSASSRECGQDKVRNKEAASGTAEEKRSLAASGEDDRLSKEDEEEGAARPPPPSAVAAAGAMIAADCEAVAAATAAAAVDVAALVGGVNGVGMARVPSGGDEVHVEVGADLPDAALGIEPPASPSRDQGVDLDDMMERAQAAALAASPSGRAGGRMLMDMD